MGEGCGRSSHWLYIIRGCLLMVLCDVIIRGCLLMVLCGVIIRGFLLMVLCGVIIRGCLLMVLCGVGRGRGLGEGRGRGEGGGHVRSGREWEEEKVEVCNLLEKKWSCRCVGGDCGMSDHLASQ